MIISRGIGVEMAMYARKIISTLRVRDSIHLSGFLMRSDHTSSMLKSNTEFRKLWSFSNNIFKIKSASFQSNDMKHHQQTFFVSTAIPYVNAKPHIGHALEYVQADVYVRAQRLAGGDVFFLTGTDDNALKNVQAAEKENLAVTEFLDRNSQIFKNTYENLGVHLDIFQRGSDANKHWPGVQKLWDACYASGDIYEKEYEGLYCVGCESFKAESDLVNGLCPDHQKKPEPVKEKNYFFRLSKYQNQILALIESGTLKITPQGKKAEIVAFIKGGLEDFSVSRSKERARGVGVPIPNDPNQVIYVWFDALAIYMTGIGFGIDEKTWGKWWPADLHIIGKDINRFHTVYWPAMLLSAKLPLPKAVLVHGFVNVDGLKISKSIGNVIDPIAVGSEFGLEAVRYYLLSQIPTDGDGDFTNDRFKGVYNANLANGLGNLVSRIAKLCEKSEIDFKPKPNLELPKLEDDYRIDLALQKIWADISAVDKHINEHTPWALSGKRLEEVLQIEVDGVRSVAEKLACFLPETAEKIRKQFTGPKIKSESPLFPRLN